ncbi:LCP family protein [Deinococcus sp.]|uniref:LCP family protein n=1 Tax=Deinococcus sp. TaxID=47478 RepID=UPI0025C171A0|nr:LCP family protein [Deinococcus sp.]
MLRPPAFILLALAGLTALLSPAVPALLRYGTLPHKAQGPINLVLAGMDVDYDWKAPVWPYPAKPLDFKTRTDTLMLAQIRPDGQINLLSIPRDTWVDIDGYGWGKINSANKHAAEASPDDPEAGPRALMTSVQKLTGVPVDGYLFLSLSAVRDLTNAAGGVRVDVPQRMKYDDNAGHLHIDLHPGPQNLSGEQAEGFLRFRHDGMSDIGRVGRQQAFISALSNKLRSPLNWWRLPGAAGAINRNTRSGLTRTQVGELLGAVLSGPKINALTLPGRFGQGGTWVVDRPVLGQLVQQHFRDPSDPRNQTISVVNLAAPAGSATRLKSRLEASGYASVQIAEEPRHETATTISGTGANRVRQTLGFGSVSNEAPTTGAEITIRLGNDTPPN